MAGQLLPILKAVAPYVAQIATAAIPAFTSKKEAPESEGVKTDPIVTKQIEELQAAASQNAHSIKMFAENLQQTISNIETASQVAEKRIAIYKVIILLSIGMSIISLSASIYLFTQ